jgi:hypothetical protein
MTRCYSLYYMLLFVFKRSDSMLFHCILLQMAAIICTFIIIISIQLLGLAASVV